MYLPYGVNDDGQLVYIESVGRGRTTLRCPYCNMRLIARKGERLAPHFAHDGKTCREVKQSRETVALPMYDSFRLHLSGKAWEALRRFHDENDDGDCYWLEDYGLVKSFITPYGNERYNLTHKGKIPFGDLSLNLFNQFQEPLIRERHETLERAAWLALGQESEATKLIDLKLFRAQMRRILETTLYFVEVRTGEGVLHKIGVTTRPLEQRLAEIRRDLAPYFGAVDLVLLGTWAHRGNAAITRHHARLHCFRTYRRSGDPNTVRGFRCTTRTGVSSNDNLDGGRDYRRFASLCRFAERTCRNLRAGNRCLYASTRWGILAFTGRCIRRRHGK